MLELNWLSVLLSTLGPSTLDQSGPREEVKFPIVESDAVVWEVRGSVYISSSLLSIVGKLSGNSLKSEESFDFKSTEASCPEASLC